MRTLQAQLPQIKDILLYQLKHHWTDVEEMIIENALPDATKAVEENFRDLPNRRFFLDGEVQFSPYMSVQWMIFLYRLSHEIYKNGGASTPKEADQVYYLNKIMHANDWFYAIDLPTHFLCEHPLGSILGRAQYGDYLFVYQGTTVGGNRSKETLYYPVFGNNVVMFANSTVLGNSHIGNNVVISAETYIINNDVPDNSIVFGKSPNLIIKTKTEEEIKSYTQHIWGWRK